jgi:hypothetical protein
LPEPGSIQVAQNSDALTEPMLFHLPFAHRPDSHPSDKRQPLVHAAGLHEISRVELASPHPADLSAELASLINTGLVRMRGGPEFCIELGFDGETNGQKADFRPALPLIFRW